MRRIPEDQLPLEVSPTEAVVYAYGTELERCAEVLLQGLPVLVECEKELTPYFYKCLRDRIKPRGLPCVYLDGRPSPSDNGPPMSLTAKMIDQLRDAVRGAVERRVVVLPHLDLLTTSSGGLTSEAREVIPLLYENPQVLCLGFKDPTFPIPKVIQNLFPRRETILGVGRERLSKLVTQREARKLGRGLDVYRLYKYLSGVNAVRIRRVLSAQSGEDYPPNDTHAWAQIRRATLSGDLTLPDLDFDTSIGGYTRVKRKLKEEILEIILRKEAMTDEAQIQRTEALIPRGMILWGPPGTGKTLFAKALASALGAAVIVVSGPELKSRWVGESEENLRQVFVRARQAAPSIIVFDELDSFACARGTFTGSGVEHSMVNQLLTELDGFRSNEMVFVVGTTNLVESIDPALLRPGRFEFQLEIPYPNVEDRTAIFNVYDGRLGLELTPSALHYAVRETGYLIDDRTRYSGDHIYAICRAMARKRLRDGGGPSEPLDVERAMEESRERPELTKAEQQVVATHEAGHAVVALHCEHLPPIDRISIKGDIGGALGFVRYGDPAHRYVVTQGQLLDGICSLFGGREAESLLLDDLSIGSAHDLERATDLGRALVERFGMGPNGVGVRDFSQQAVEIGLAEGTKAALDRAVGELLEQQRLRASTILKEHAGELAALRDLLLERQHLDSAQVQSVVSERKAEGESHG